MKVYPKLDTPETDSDFIKLSNFNTGNKNSSENDSVLIKRFCDLPVRIETAGNTIVISMPPVIKKYLKTPRYLKMQMRAAFMKYQFEHPEKPLRQVGGVNGVSSMAVARAFQRLLPKAETKGFALRPTNVSQLSKGERS